MAFNFLSIVNTKNANNNNNNNQISLKPECQDYTKHFTYVPCLIFYGKHQAESIVIHFAEEETEIDMQPGSNRQDPNTAPPKLIFLDCQLS